MAERGGGTSLRARLAALLSTRSDTLIILSATPHDGRGLAEPLSRECLRYLYRLLFLFYIEARPELGYAPMKSDAYRAGYSLESLRDLELTPLLNRVKFRNPVLQKVIERMSLTRSKGRKDRRGRVSYAQLGINQLGAVYEALLSYRGFFAEEDLYEVKRTGEDWNELDTAYFVKAEDLPRYEDEEKVYDPETGEPIRHPKGKFIYRLAGRDREKSASYYTPEVLTRCLVKYALKELLQNKSADEILKLTVCEPAMGSAAFLNEAVNQLAEAYLRAKRRETGRLITHEDYPRELQRVKMYLADNNVFGVDLNPVAVELAEVSLWLNTIHEGGFVPWFGMQLACGNSLIGARRQVFSSRLLRPESKSSPLWLDEVPQPVPPFDKAPDTVPPFDKGGLGGIFNVLWSIAGGEIPLNPPFSKGEVKDIARFATK